MRDILRTCEEPYERPAQQGSMIADGALKHGVLQLQGIQHGLDSYWATYFQSNFVTRF